MKYLLVCLYNKEINKYQKDIVTKIYKKLNRKIPEDIKKDIAHFTIKYPFDANPKQLTELKKIISKFSKTQNKQKTIVGGFGNRLRKEVLFIKIKYDSLMEKTILKLHSKLRKVRWLSWKEYDINKSDLNRGLELHLTLMTNPKKEDILAIKQILTDNKKCFETYFDNITIMKLPKNNKWVLEKRYNLQ